MKTEDLIRTLAADTHVERGLVERTLAGALAPVAAIAAALFYLMFGLRAHLTSAPVAISTALKLTVTLPLAATGIAAVLNLARPGAPRFRALALLATPLVIVVGLVIFDLATAGVAGWEQRLFGKTYIACLLSIPSLSLLPLAAVMIALSRGAPERPALSGAIAGMAAAGVGASIYALHCPEDSALFLAAWYGLSTLVMAALGAAIGSRFLRW